MNDHDDQFNELYQPCGSGLIYHSKVDFEVLETDERLAIKAPKSKVPQLVITSVLTLVGLLVFIHVLMPEYKVLFYVAGIPTFLLVIFIIYVLVGSEHKKGDWLVWDKSSGKIDFPRLSKTDIFENFICFQMVHDEGDGEGAYEEVNCVFKTGGSFVRYPLFLTDSFTMGSHIHNMAHPFGVGVQRVCFQDGKPVVGGYQFES